MTITASMPMASATRRSAPAGWSCTRRSGLAPDARGIEDDDVGRQPDGEAPAVGEAEHLGGPRGQHVHRLLELERALLAHPVAEQVGREAGVAELARVRAGVRETEHGVRREQQLRHLVLVEVHDRDAEARLELGRDAEVEHEIERVHAALAGDLGERALLETRLGGHARDPGALPPGR